MTRIQKLLSFAIALGLVALGPAAAHAQAERYPARPIRIVVPFAAGGAVDTLARLVGGKLGESIGQPVIIENRAGAGGNLAAEIVAKAAADGYTILLTTNGLAIAPSLYNKLPFDPAQDFRPVTQVVASALVLVASPKSELKTVQEFVAAAKARPGGLNYGSTGIANPLHLTMEMIKIAAGLDVQPVPYRGDAPLMAALIAGEIEVAVVPMITARPHIDGGRLRALAVTAGRRSSALPDVPTLMEQGVAVDSSSWNALFAPAQTPPEIVETIQRETRKVLGLADVRERINGFGAEPVGSTPDEFAALFKADILRFARIVEDAKIPKQD